jgi:hypothetical protein
LVLIDDRAYSPTVDETVGANAPFACRKLKFWIWGPRRATVRSMF